PAPTANEHRNRCASLLRYLVWYRLSCAVLCYAAGISFSYAFDFTLYDHSTRPYYDAPFTAFDYPPLTRLYIVTGTDNWPNNNVDFFSVRVCNAQGVPLIASINIPRGTPLGTVVSTQTVYNGTPWRFDTGTSIWGYPHHIETYYGDPNPYVGDAEGDGWTITYIKSGDGGWNGCDLV